MFKGSSSRKFYYLLLLFVAIIAGLGTIIGFAGRFWWLFELASHFRAQYFLLLTITGFLFLLGRRFKEAALVGVFVLVNLSLILPFYTKPVLALGNERSLEVLMLNVREGNHHYTPSLDLIQESKPDLILLLESSYDWIDALSDIEKEYPYTFLLPRNKGNSIALYSRIPFEEVESWDINGIGRPAIIARFIIDGQPFILLGVHTSPPNRPDGWEQRNEQLRQVADFIKTQETQVVVLGDLNTSPWSPFFFEFLRESILRDGRRGFGLQPTWPASWPLLRLPIDHFLASDGVVVQEFTTGPQVDSDHLPLIVDFSLASD